MTAIEPGKRPLPAPSLEEDYALLKKAVRAAGDLALTYFRKSIIVKRKVDGSEVSEADLAIDVALKIELHVPRPDYGWLSEETEDDSERLKSSRVWMVDPIDGTNAFLRHVPEWTVSAALVENGRPVLGAVFNPATNETTIGSTGTLKTDGITLQPSTGTLFGVNTNMGGAIGHLGGFPTAVSSPTPSPSNCPARYAWTTR